MKKSIHLSSPKRFVMTIGILVAIFLLMSSCKNREKSFQAPLFENIGDYRMSVTHHSKNAKQFFDQGMIFTYGFNHGEAARSFREAIRLDSSFAMAYWGLAYTLGPNYNASLDPSNKEEIVWAIEKASNLKNTVKEWERLLIEASEAKYSFESDNVDLEAFAERMKVALQKNPSNSDVGTLYAEALMLQHPWDLYDYKGGPARKWTPEIVEVLESALKSNADHPLAKHLYIHAMEASDRPEDAADEAMALHETIIPGAGHLVHMPSHIYINTGDYHTGTEVNIDAVQADSIYSAQCKAQGAFPLYYYHNYHFLAACAALEGRGALAIESSFKMTTTIDKSLLGKPGFETTQHFMTVPYNVLVKFAQWEKILALSRPDVKYPYMVAMWHYARGMAYANLKQLTKAQEELDALDRAQTGAGFEDFLIFSINSGQMVIDIAMNVLGAEIARKTNDFSKAEELLKQAVSIEDQMSYNEPPDWFFSVRHLLGELYMDMGKLELAEEAYSTDLVNFPKNGFALNGLYHSLMEQGRLEEAEKVKALRNKAWAYADTLLKYSRVDEKTRTNLVVKIDSKSPAEMVRFSSVYCGILPK